MICIKFIKFIDQLLKIYTFGNKNLEACVAFAGLSLLVTLVGLDELF